MIDNGKQKPLFFVFTCVKNGRPYIEKLFFSLLEQTEINFVHFIYDDGSNDPIDDLVEEYKRKSLKLKTPFEIVYLKNKHNIGLNMATQYCIRQCNLPYFIWINCDDWFDKNFFKYARKYVLKNPNASILKSNMVISVGAKKKKWNENIFDYIYCHKKTQLMPFLTDHLYMPHFIVKYEDFINFNRDKKLLDLKDIFNDEQIYYPFILLNKSFYQMKKSKTFWLIRNDSEFHSLIARNPSYNKLLELLKLNGYESYFNLRHFYKENSRNLLFEYYHFNYKRFRLFYKERKQYSKNHNIPYFYWRYKRSYIAWIITMRINHLRSALK